MAANRTCIVCGNKYEYCRRCSNNSQPTWKTLFDTDTCHDIYHIIGSYRIGELTAEDAKNYILSYDIAHIKEINPRLKQDYEKIMGQSDPEIVNKD